ncbi:MAG TPA: hypothetical protein VGF67_03765 [Ktedonobacteraceae bacterium]
MDISPQPRRQASGTYIVPGRFDEEELTRQPIQDQFITNGTSEAFNRLRDLLVHTFYQAGYLFAPEPNSLLNEIPRLMKQQGIRNIETHTHTLEIHGGTPTGQAFAEDVMRALPALIPFLQKWLRLPDDFDRLARQAVSDTQLPEFLATWKLLTTWGNRAQS